MDRESIERRDFPTGRRGYDPAAVDEHLRRVADEFEARVHQPPTSLAAGASEQVRLILEAAERGASELRARAGEEASDHVARVQVAADGMVTKLDAVEAELNRLLSALRESGERLTQGLAELQADVADAAAASAPAASPPAASSSPPASSSPSTGDPMGPPASSSPSTGDPVGPPASSSPSTGDPMGPPASSSPSTGDPVGPPASSSPSTGDPDGPPASSSPPAAPEFDAFEEDFAASSPGEPDEAGARLIALNMALSGSSREETARYLADHFAIADPAALLDDVYARAGR